MDKLNYHDIRGRQKADGWSPGPGSFAHKETRTILQSQIPFIGGVNRFRDETEWKNLPFVRMSGKLQIKKTNRLFIDQGSMFKKQVKFSLR